MNESIEGGPTKRVEYIHSAFIDLQQPTCRHGVGGTQCFSIISLTLCAPDMIVKMTLSQQQLFEPDKTTENNVLTSM